MIVAGKKNRPLSLEKGKDPAWNIFVASASRAAHYGMSVDAYKKKNVLGTEVRSADVAEMAAEMCGALFSKTTGVQVPVDGGNDRVI